MLKHCLVGAMSVFLVQLDDGNTGAIANTQAQLGEASTSQPSNSTPSEAKGASLRVLNRTLCFGQQADGARCDYTLGLPSTRAANESAQATGGASDAEASAEDPFAWRFELLRRSICIGAVPDSASCDYRLKPPAAAEASASSV